MSVPGRLLAKASAGTGLLPDEVKEIIRHVTVEEWPGLFDCARRLTENNFNRVIHFFAPLYFSNYCINDCSYCGFRVSNRSLPRKNLNTDEFVQEAKYLWRCGHRSILLIAGEHPVYAGVSQIMTFIRELQKHHLEFNLMAELAPLCERDYLRLSEWGVSYCVLFQETYNEVLYREIHRGKKQDYHYRYESMARALSAGIKNVGLGILVGLNNWEEELIALIRHAYELKETFATFPATFSFPRIKAAGGECLFHGFNIADEVFQKMIVLARLACPEVGIVLSTREPALLRRRIVEQGLGITHMSAGVQTAIGGYALQGASEAQGQFDLSDRRSLENVIREIEGLSYHPHVGR